MNTGWKFLIEVLIIGAITALTLFILTRVILPNTTGKILLLGFLTGAIVHILFEIFGGNIAYCKYRLK
jgi:hypothetical protein